jgi:N-carbamoyl-L-amino-acid hydrolase
MVGELEPSILTVEGPGGFNLARAIDSVGGDSSRIGEARLEPGSVLGQLELHIEQGPELEARGIPVGIVTAIALPNRGAIDLTGRAEHAGGTSMARRLDALCGAAEMVLALERLVRTPGLADSVGTVGYIEVEPNMPNVVPGRVRFIFETRSPLRETLRRVQELFQREADLIAQRRGLGMEFQWLSREDPVTLPRSMVALLEESCRELGIPFTPLFSWAGHDSAHLASLVPVGMVFVPCRDGRSHCPDEWADFEEIATGTRVLARAILKLDSQG